MTTLPPKTTLNSLTANTSAYVVLRAVVVMTAACVPPWYSGTVSFSGETSEAPLPLRVEVSAQDLAASRFAVSPLFEVQSALRQPYRGSRHGQLVATRARPVP